MSPSLVQPIPDPTWAAESNLPRILIVTGIIHVLALISVGLRLYVRIGLLRTPGRDDVVIVAAALGALGGWICFVLQGYHGLGRHTIALSIKDRVAFDHIGFAQSIISAIGALGLLKISIAFFLLRLSKDRWYSRSLWALIVFVAVYSVGAWLTFFLRCRPMSGFWDKNPNADCYSIHLFVIVALLNTAFNIFTDICFATLPIHLIWNLQMSRRTRNNLIGILSLGYLAVAMGIVKAVYQIAFAKNRDKHFEQSVQFWGFLQLNVGIVASSIPTMKPLLRRSAGGYSGNQHNPYGGSERSKKSRGPKAPNPRRPFLPIKDAKLDAASYEMSNKFPTSSPSREIDIYCIEEQRTGSEDHILKTPSVDSQGILRTTEVFVDNVEKTG